MKKQIRLLIENLFDDIYDIDQGTDLSVEIADEHLKYNYFPKDYNELRNLLTKLLKERGKHFINVKILIVIYLNGMYVKLKIWAICFLIVQNLIVIQINGM